MSSIVTELDEAEQIDSFVRHWVKDVPYVIVRSDAKSVTVDDETWKSYGRRYILQTDLNGASKGNLLTEFATLRSVISDDLSVLQGVCADVLRYFQFGSPMNTRSIASSLRINGVRLVLPRDTKRRITIVDLYEFLDLPMFNLESLTIINEKGWHAVISPPRGTEPLIQGLKAEDVGTVMVNGLSHIFSRDDIDGCLLRIPVEGMGMDAPSYSTQSKLYQKTAGVAMFHMAIMIAESQQLWAFSLVANMYAAYSYAMNRCVVSERRWIVTYIGFHEGSQGHGNVLLIDKHRGEVYLFDPHGHQMGWDQDKIAEDVLSALGVPSAIYGWRVRAREDWCPRLGGQMLEMRGREAEVGGYCSAWSMWIIELLMKYPDVELSVLHKRALQNISLRYDGDVSQFIEEYTQRLKTSSSYTINPIEPDPKVDRALLATLVEHPVAGEFSLYELPEEPDERERSWRALVFASEGRCFFYRVWNMAYAIKGFGTVKMRSNVFDGLTPLTFGAVYDNSKQKFFTALREEDRQYYKIYSVLSDHQRKRLFPYVAAQ